MKNKAVKAAIAFVALSLLIAGCAYPLWVEHLWMWGQGVDALVAPAGDSGSL